MTRSARRPAAPRSVGTERLPASLRSWLGWAAVLLLAAAPVAWGQDAATLTLDEALSRADQRSGVVNALLAANDARRGLERTEADPLALRIDRLQAEQAAERTQRDLVVARFDAYAEIGSAYVQAAAAERQLALARSGRDLAARSVEIARIRADRGSATALDVQTAENDLADADGSLAAARQGRDLAFASLGSLLGVNVATVAPLDDALLVQALDDLPDDAELEASLDRSPRFLQALHGLELARVGRDLLDPSFAAQAQIDQADLQVEQAETAVAEARRGLILQARSLRNRVDGALDRWDVARDAARIAAERTELERQRLEAGLISDIAFRQSELQREQAELARAQARHDLLTALLEFQAGTGIGLEGLDAF